MRNDDRKLSVAILGTRGVPPRYGGFETFAGELGRRLSVSGTCVTWPDTDAVRRVARAGDLAGDLDSTISATRPREPPDRAKYR